MSLETEVESVAELALADTDVNWDRFISCAQFTILSPFSLYALNKDDCFRPIWVLLGHYSLVPLLVEFWASKDCCVLVCIVSLIGMIAMFMVVMCGHLAISRIDWWYHVCMCVPD